MLQATSATIINPLPLTRPAHIQLSFSWPGETAKPEAALINIGAATSDPNNIGDFYMGSTSAPCNLTVQTDPVPTWPESPVPTDYWTRPISGANRDWASLPSNWLLGTWLYQNVQLSGTGPKSPHILWSNPIIPGYPGGLVDAQWPSISSKCQRL